MTEQVSSHRSTNELPRPAIQLHTLRSSSDSLPELIRKVDEAGFEGVEFAGRFLEANPHTIRDVLTETGVVPVAAHIDLKRLETNPESIVDRCRAVGCRRVVIPHIGGGHFRTPGRIDSMANRLNALSERLELDGIQLLYHNSREPFLPSIDRPGIETLSRVPLPDGSRAVISKILSRNAGTDTAATFARTGFGRLLERTSDGIGFEIDTGWIVAAGYDPLTVFDLVGDRLALIHLTDVMMTRRFPLKFESVPPGEGSIDLSEVLPAARKTSAEWLVYENDDATDLDRAIRDGIDAVTHTATDGTESHV